MSRRQFTRQEVAELAPPGSTRLIIDNVVYDVTEFLEEHPGGRDVLLGQAGRDASQCFREVGHSDIALEWRAHFAVGEVAAAERWEVPAAEGRPGSPPAPPTWRALAEACLPPLLLAALATVFYSYMFQ